MNLHLAENYTGEKGKKYPFPSDSTPQKNKDDKKYYLQATQAIVTRFLNNYCEIPYGAFEGRRTMDTLEAYALGKQGSDMYKNTLIGHKDNNGCRPQSTINIDWTLIDILPKKLGDVKGYMQKLKYDIVTTAIDPMAVFSKDMVKAAAKLASSNLMSALHEEINELAGGMAVNPDGQLVGQTANAVPFQNPDQVESFAKIGGIQLTQEIAMKILLDKTQYDSVSDVLNDMIIDDLLMYGICGKKYYSETGGDTVLWDHVTMKQAIVPWSKYPDFRDATYFGELKRITIGELRRTSNLEEKEIIEIANKYNTAPYNKQYNLPNFYQAISDSRDQGLGIAVLDSIMVDVADVEWLGCKSTVQTSVTRKREGNLAINNVDEDYNLSEREKNKGKEVKKYERQVVYKAKMILGTDHVFDYGLLQNMPYRKDDKGKMVPVMSYSFYKLSGPSLAEKCIGFVNDANMALLKKRMIIKNLTTGQNIRINQSAFENVKINNKLQSPADLMALFRDEGFLIVDDKNPWGQNTSTSRPIDIIPSDVAQRLMECRRELEWNLSMIEQITGLNAIFSASTPSSETGLGVAKIAVNATENSIYTIIKAYENQFEQGLKIAAHFWKVKVYYMDDKKRENFATDRAMEMIKVGKEIALHDFDIKLEAGMTEDEKLMLMQKVNQLGDFRRQAGTGGITPSDELTVFEIIKSGNLKMARVVLAQIEEFRKNQDEEIAEKRYRENAELQKSSNEQASANKQAEIQTEAQAAGQQKMMEIQAEMQLEQLKAENKRKEIALSNIYGWGLDSYKKTVK